MSAFDPSSYGDHAVAVYDQLYPNLEAGLVAKLAVLADGGAVLDLGIGTGRVAIPLRRAGVRVQGIEASAAMISAFRDRPGNDGIPVVHGDFSRDSLGASFQLIYSLVSTLFLLPCLSRQQQCLHNIARHLPPGGLFVSEAYSDASSFPSVEVTEAPINTPNGIHLYRVTMLSTPPELFDSMALQAGLHLTQRWSNWSEAPYRPQQSRHISVYRREAEPSRHATDLD